MSDRELSKGALSPELKIKRLETINILKENKILVRKEQYLI